MSAQEEKILALGGSAEIVISKSRFIATLRPAETEEEATAFIAEMKKKYWDAKHNCTAFVIGEGAQLTRCSDDGEPAGTAGRPMLEALLGSGVRNAAVVVTRYFGGVLLGTGGLVRAYTQAVQAGLAACRVGTVTRGREIELSLEYSDLARVKQILEAKGVTDPKIEYGADIRLEAGIPLELLESLQASLTDATSGRIRIKLGDPVRLIGNTESFSNGGTT